MQNFDFLNYLVKKIAPINLKVTENDVLDFLKIRKRWPKNFHSGQRGVETINQLGVFQQSFFEIDGYINFEKFKEFYDLGYTAVISNVLDLRKDLRELGEMLEKEVGNPINANFYFGNNNESKLVSWNNHSHHYDVIVKNIYGQSYWEVAGEKFTLKKQDTMLIPKNTLHRVYKTNGKRLSLTMNIE